MTGGTDGIGFGYAIELAKLGCNVIIISRSESKLIEKCNFLETTYNVKIFLINRLKRNILLLIVQKSPKSR